MCNCVRVKVTIYICVSKYLIAPMNEIYNSVKCMDITKFHKILTQLSSLLNAIFNNGNTY